MPALLFSLIGLAACSNANAGCLYGGDEPGVGQLNLMRASMDLLHTKMWFEDAKNPYPNGTLMLLKEVKVDLKTCNAGTFPAEFKNETLRLVYFPPSLATRNGNRFRIPTTSEGVAFEVEFPGKGTFGTDGIDLGTSGGPVIANLGVARGFDIFILRLSMVKTGPLSSTAPSAPQGLIGAIGSITLGTEQLGTFKFYSEDGTRLALAGEKIVFPEQKLVANTPNWVAYAGAPVCRFTAFPLNPSNIKLPDVSQQKFKAVGAIEDGGKTQNIDFQCWGLLSTKPEVTFEATYPLTGAVGVGMQSASSDVGVQIFLDDQPVELGKAFGIDIPMNSFPTFPGGPSNTSGSFCQANCGSDMSGAGWVDGESGIGKVSSPFRFKYYQTTSKTPAVQQLVVPFSITVDVQ